MKEKMSSSPSSELSPPDDALVSMYDSRNLFRGRQEILIEHAGHAYRLRITRQDKLILTK
jgi:hemin uptake protein HemP